MIVDALNFHLLSPEEQAAFRLANPPPVVTHHRRKKAVITGLEPPPAPAQCIHLGKALSHEQAARLELGTVRTWQPCAKGHGEKGKPAGYVACCLKGSVCGPACGDYAIPEDHAK